MDEHTTTIQTTLEKLLEQIKEAEKLAQAKDTHSEHFKVLLAGIRQRATVGREQSKLGGGETSHEGCFIGLLDDLDRVERADQEWRTVELEETY